jgi:hypothetical protein
VRAELSQPGRIRNIGFATGQILHMSGVDQHHLDTHQVFKQVVERFPVIAGGFHDYAGDPLSHEVLTQRQDLAGRGSPRRHCLDRSTSSRPGQANAHLGVPFRDIHSGAPGVDHFHRRAPFLRIV